MGSMEIIRWLKTLLLSEPKKRPRTQQAPAPNLKELLGAKRKQASGRRQEMTQPKAEYSTKRRHERFSVEGMELKAKAALTDVIELSNVSVGGACIVTTRTLSPGDNVLLKIPSGKVEKPLKCTIIWETVNARPLDRNGLNVPSYRAGVKFNDVPPGTIVRLKDFMRNAGVPDDGSRSRTYKPTPLRYSILLNGKTSMNYAATFPVKKISLGGMLVEAESELEIGGLYPAALYLPDSDRRITFKGRVASKIPRADGFDAGIEFCDMTSDDRGRLSAFLDILASSH